MVGSQSRVAGLIWATILLSGYPPIRLSAQSAQDPWPVLDRASATYQSTSTLSADFVQIVENPLVGAPDTTRGKLYQMRPSRFAMRFAVPNGDRIVGDGRYPWVDTPGPPTGK